MFDRVHSTRLTVALATVCATFAIAPGAMAADQPIGLQCTNGTTATDGGTGITTRTFRLTADHGTMETPDGNSNLMWSYEVTNGDQGFQTPGPILCANQNERVRIELHNTLPAATSIVFPGQKTVASTGSAGLFTKEAPAGGDATYEFTATDPGTFVYESGTDPAKQVEMGLASALVVRPAGHPTWAYGNSRTAFNPDREYILILNEIDPELHSAVEKGDPYDILSRHDRYFTVNGRSFPDTLQDSNVPWLPTQPYGALVRIQPYDATSNPLATLIRIVNVGLDPHPFHPHGQSLRMVGMDGHPLEGPTGQDGSSEHFGETVPSGATEDFTFSWTDQDNFSPSNPSPGAAGIPDYQDLTFKDANTWYSGSPYLGTIGDMPDGTVSQNVCGAFYFPWHSHALNEFANYEAGFGGMATMLRVDPPGDGCSAVAGGGSVTHLGSPTAVTTIAPTTTPLQNQASLVAGLAAADDTGGFLNLPLRASFLSNTNNILQSRPRTTDWYATFSGLPASGVGVQNLKVTYEGSGRSGGCSQDVSIDRWDLPTHLVAGTPLTLDSRTVATTDIRLSDLDATGTNDAQYVNAAGQVRVHVKCSLASGSPFTSSGDFMQISYIAP